VTISGECFCGDISYRVSGPLKDARSCHCSRCRKAFSAQASAYALVDPTEFQWLTGEHQLSSYVAEHGFGLQFCSNCGSTLCGILDGVVHGVTLGCVNGNPGVEIARHIYAGSKAAWELLPEHDQIFQEGAPE